MEYAALGSLSASRIGFGCAAMGGFDYGPVDDEVSVAAVDEALGGGINFFDVADVYGFGHAEEVLGRALSGRRHDAVIATKFGLGWDERGVRRDGSPAHIARAVEDSLRRLRTDVVDLYQMHWPDPATPLAETAGALARLRDAGKIREIGCCNFTLAQLQELHALVPVATYQAPLNLLCRGIEEEVLPWCEANGIRVLAHSVLARGYLAGRRGGSSFEANDTRPRSRYFAPENAAEKERVADAMAAAAANVGRSISNVAARWVLDRGAAVALIGMKTPAQVREHLGAAGWTLEGDAFAALTAVSTACPGVMSGELAR
ncbi:MAG TPA: aldo/keto reductase [Thermoanaerobaculia bacterium]|nr:aldo/keto reductase [Thermoanaerobaculia bacterium]